MTVAIGPDRRWWRIAVLATTGVLLVFLAAELWVAFSRLNWSAAVDSDRQIYAQAAQRWLHGGGFYLPRQLGGPYATEVGDVLYPPTALYLFLPLSYVPILWYAIPVGVLGYLLARWRPALWAWPLMAASLAYPESLALIRSGNPDLWVLVAIAGGLQWGFPGAFVLLKPSVLPFALAGIRTRAWWGALALLVLLTVPLLPMLADWLRAVSDAQGYGGLLYSLDDIPLLVLPIWAWLARDRSRRGPL